MSSSFDRHEFESLVIEKRLYNANALAAHLNMSVRQLERHFKVRYGKSPQVQLNEWRLQHAKVLIERGEPVKVVAAHFGFTELSNFSRAYRKAFGYCPTHTKITGRSDVARR